MREKLSAFSFHQRLYLLRVTLPYGEKFFRRDLQIFAYVKKDLHGGKALFVLDAIDVAFILSYRQAHFSRRYVFCIRSLINLSANNSSYIFVQSPHLLYFYILVSLTYTNVFFIFTPLLYQISFTNSLLNTDSKKSALHL